MIVVLREQAQHLLAAAAGVDHYDEVIVVDIGGVEPSILGECSQFGHKMICLRGVELSLAFRCLDNYGSVAAVW